MAEPVAEETWGVVEAAGEYYEFTLESPKATRPGTRVVANIGVTAVAPWHVNLEFPASLSTEPTPGVAFANATQTAKDALHFAENGAAFELAFTPADTGRHEVRGTFKFAVCQADACRPQTEDFAFYIDVAE